MAKALAKRERLKRTLDGRKVDRLPVALWRHFFVEEVSREGLVEAMVRWQKTCDWDFLKINPRACYHVQDWGSQYEFSGNEHIPPTLVRPAVRRPDDLRRLRPLVDSPVLAEHLGAVRDIAAALGRGVPALMTVFGPMSVAAELAGGPQDLAHLIRQDPEAVHAGLRAIADTFARFTARCVEAGAAGIFLATTHCGTQTNFTVAEYETFGRPYDLKVLRAVRDAPFNLLHVCKARSMVRELADYPVALLNWDMADATNPGLAEMAALAPGKALVGGIGGTLFTGTGAAAAVADAVADARRAMGERPFVVGSTCTLDTRSDPEAVRAAREAVGK